MYMTGSGEPIAANTADLETVVNEVPGDRAVAIGRVSLSFAPQMTRTAELEAAGRADTFEWAMRQGKIVDWLPNIDHNETSTAVVADHVGV